MTLHGIHRHVQDALQAQPFLLPGHVLPHRPLKQVPGHGVEELGHGEDVAGVAQGQVVVELVG